MPKTLDDMVTKGRAKLTAKKDLMVDEYRGAIDTMIEGYKALPFGPRTKETYEKMVREVAASHYSAALEGTDWIDRWATKWKRKVSR